MKYSVNAQCPCGSGLKYKQCCLPYHKGKLPKNALVLMKSRYSGFVVADAKYIIKTTHKENQDYTDDFNLWEKEILQFSHNGDFQKLEILEFVDGEFEAYVTFKATIFFGSEDASFIEKSKFYKIERKWLYHSGEFLG